MALTAIEPSTADPRRSTTPAHEEQAMHDQVRRRRRSSVPMSSCTVPIASRIPSVALLGPDRRRVVVALDRSPLAADALRWAVEEAGLRGLAVHVVSNRLELARVPIWHSGVDQSATAVRERAKRVQEDIVRATLGELPPNVRLRLVVCDAPLAIAVAASGRGADLMVVAGGAKGLHARVHRHALLRWTRRVDCPVVVISSPIRRPRAAPPVLRLVSGGTGSEPAWRSARSPIRRSTATS